MLKLNTPVKRFLTSKCGVDAKAGDDQFRKAAGAALAEGTSGFDFPLYQKLLGLKDDDNEGFKKLVGDAPAPTPATGLDKTDEIMKMLGGINGNFKSLTDRLDALEGKASGGGGGAGGDDDEDEDEDEAGKNGDPEADKSVKASRFEKMLAGIPLDATKGPLLASRGSHEQYGTDKSAAKFPSETTRGTKHQFAGQRAFEGGRGKQRPLSESSELEQAVNGAWGKFMIQQGLGVKCPRQLRLTEHEQGLVQYALTEMKWAGVIGGECSRDEGAVKVKNRKLKPGEIKAILDDSVSGGLEITPISFDDQIILTPILFGEFANRINMIPITRGRRIEGASMSNVSLGQSTEGTAITLFNTAGFISAFDTTIYVVAGAIEIGLDELSDSPIDIGGIVTGQYGRKLLEWMDNVICDGDGTTEPEGIIQASGTVSVNHSSAAPTVGSYESLLFGIAKKYKQGFDRARICFGGTETSYQRARAIAVGASDTRRVFGMNQENYMLFSHHYGVNEQLANTEIFFGNLGRFRMYRRQGLTFTVTTEGKELVLDNEMLLSCRARFGGQIEDGNAFAVVTDGQA